MKVVVTLPADVAGFVSPLVVAPDDPERWLAGLVRGVCGKAQPEHVMTGTTRDGWPMQLFEVGGGLAALYTFLAYAAVVIVCRHQGDAVREALARARPDWSGPVAALAQFYAEDAA